MKTTTMTLTLGLLLTTLAAATPASAAGVCVGYCVEASPDTTTINDTDVRTCAGNLVIQIGVENDSHMCDGDNNGGSGTGTVTWVEPSS